MKKDLFWKMTRIEKSKMLLAMYSRNMLKKNVGKVGGKEDEEEAKSNQKDKRYDVIVEEDEK